MVDLLHAARGHQIRTKPSGASPPRPGSSNQSKKLLARAWDRVTPVPARDATRVPACALSTHLASERARRPYLFFFNLWCFHAVLPCARVAPGI